MDAVAAHGSKSRVPFVGLGGMVELSSASVANLPLEFVELLELIDRERFLAADIVTTRTPRSLSAIRKKRNYQSADCIGRIFRENRHRNHMWSQTWETREVL
jgi:hypothetical protein